MISFRLSVLLDKYNDSNHLAALKLVLG